ncbi:MAG: hypothetical protein COS85_01590 [Armatimonadetes bacterium CG07_land_8_20_14_0_80_59_28]|nr:MAG: hypothetical protein COS85_01590 [Armatimonadetes bacterium CG07_land_8_20_14_0_80_59_28]PIX38283.1 MAG: hypothetical protein COZ56_20820 [Armatimonadetes bacterium CG_4_8_14_3_um_filter_58_9]
MKTRRATRRFIPHSEIRIFKGIAHDRSVTTENENGREFFLTAAFFAVYFRRRNDEGSPLRQRFFTPFRMTEGGQYF